MTAKTTLNRIRALVLVIATGIVASCGNVQAQPIGGSGRVLATWDGQEKAAFLHLVKPFEQQTGIKVIYTSTTDLSGKLWKALAVGDLPDVAGLPGPGEMQELARAGALVDLKGAIDIARYKRETAQAFVQLGTVDDQLVGIFTKS